MNTSKRLCILLSAFLSLLCSCTTSSGPGPGSATVITLDDYVLTGTYADGEVTFQLRATAHAPKAAGEIVLLSGQVSPISVPDALAPLLNVRGSDIILKTDTWSSLAVKLPFRANVREADGWKNVDFIPAAANIRQIVLEGWPADAKVELPDASQAVRKDGRITANLPGSGHVQLRWKDVPPATAGKLFFSAEGAVVNTFGPGILRQTNQIIFHVLQGKLENIDLDIAGEGEVTRVDGQGTLTPTTTPGDKPGTRRLSVKLNAPQTGDYLLTVQLETPLPKLPATATPPRVSPVGASSFGGWLRVQNEGAVRLEVQNASGLSQIAPEQFPVARPPNAAPSTQAFAYRFADAGYTYAIKGDNVTPEFTTDSIIVYHLGETDTNVQAEINLDIREAPLRELTLLVPADWAIAALNAPNLADRFVTPAANGRAQLRLVFSQPLIGRQVVRLRLERNATPTAAGAAIPAPADWTVPPLTVVDAKSGRGFVGVTSDASLRLTPTNIGANLADATASFPLKLDNLQAAWRFHEEPWSAAFRVEHLAASVQADALHIFSLGGEMALGSTVLNLNIAGAPVNVIRLQNTGGYRNVEFTGRYKRDVTQNGDVYEVHLDHPVSGAYTMLATYELPFKATGDSLAFTGMRPLDVQTEQGHVLIASSHPFTVTPAKISPEMTRLEAAEIPAEYRLLCDAPILACYQYPARPFEATLQLQPLAAGSTVDQVVDIGELDTHVSATGEVITTARYVLKSKGHDFLRLSLPAKSTLWSVTVANNTVVPVADKDAAGAQSLLVPLPRKGDPNAPVLVELKYTAAAKDAAEVTLAAPVLQAAVLVTDWNLSADNDRVLHTQDNAPVVENPRVTGLGWLATTITDGPFLSPEPIIVPVSEGVRPSFYLGLVSAFLGVIVLRVVRGRAVAVRMLGGLAGLALSAYGVIQLLHFGLLAQHATDLLAAGASLHLSIPVTEAGHALSYTFANVAAPKSPPAYHVEMLAWLILPGAVGALLGWLGGRGVAWCAVSWVLILAGALGLPLGPLWFCLLLALGLAVAGVRGLWKLKGPSVPAAPPAQAAAVTAGLILCLGLAGTPKVHAADAPAPAPKPGLVLSLTQTGSVQEGYVRMQAALSWRAEKGGQIMLLRTPAVLTAYKGDPAHLTLAQDPAGNGYLLSASDAGTYQISFNYEVLAGEAPNGDAGVVLPTPGGLVNQVTLDLARADLAARSEAAVALRTTTGAEGKPRVMASFAPDVSPLLRWSPRARDLSAEKPVYYADWRQLFAPAAGLVDGTHQVHVNLAQGEIKELVFSVPQNLTISAMTAEGLVSWRFDPDQRKLHAYFEPARKTAFDVSIHSQASTSTLPYTATLTPIRLDGATADSGLLATATGSEVELGTVTPENLSGVNLDDFPAGLVRVAAPQGNPYTVRRAYHYGAEPPSLKAEALAVEPDVRVDSLQRLSLGEDRVLLAAHLNVAITRAGIFKLSFALPAGFELESLSGDQLSQWTESTTGGNRVITLNLKGKTLGNAAFDITLSSPGLAARTNWAVPHLLITEAGKQTGQLVLLPELGLRPQVSTRNNLTQIDPKDAGLTISNALVFRLLQSDWSLALNIDKVPPHIQVDTLQDVTVRDGSTEVRANLHYQIDNAGVRELRLQVPADATGVRITGAQVSDSAPIEGQASQWLVRLQRRSIGELNLAITYQLPAVGADNKVTVNGLLALGVDLQRGYVDVRTRSRLEARLATTSPMLQPADWESVPSNLRRDFDGSAPSQTFRAVEPAFTLPLNVVRHDAAEVLPARVESVAMRSLVSPDGQLLTAVTIHLHPGDKRYLHVQLPADSKFWFAFVNDKGVAPSLASAANPGDVMLPLEPNPVPSEATTVEFLYQQKVPAAAGLANLAGPRIDLPLQNISWRLYLPESWKVGSWGGPWQKSLDANPPPGDWPTLNDYLASGNSRISAQNAKAENFRQLGTQLLQQGRQVQARDLFSNAYQISEKDSSLNEDVRVQWQNLRETQAMVTLNNVVNVFGNSNNIAINGGNAQNSSLANPVLSQTELLSFTDQEARKVLGANGAEENAVLAALAHSLVMQQADTLPHPVAIHATLPERGQVYDFTQSLLVNPNADLSLKIAAVPAGQPVAWGAWLVLIALGLLLAGLWKLSDQPARA